MISDSPRAARIVRFSVTLAAGGFLLAYGMLAAFRVRYPFELEWMEGGGLEHVRRLLSGRQIYVRPSLDFIPYPYTPLYYYVCALIARLSGQTGFLSMRLVSIAASVAVSWLIVAIVRRATSRWYPAWLACGLMAGSYGLTDGWFDIARVDSLFLALLLATVYAIQSGTTRALLIAGVCLSLSFLVKQTALLIGVPLMIWCVIVDRKRSLFFLTPAAVILAGTTYYFQSVTSGWYWYYIFELQRHVGHLLRARVLTFWTGDMLPMGIAAVLAGIHLVASTRRLQPRSSQLISVAALAMIGASWMSRVRVGNFVNALMPAYAGVAILCGIAVADLERRWRPLDPTRRSRLESSLAVLCLLQFVILAWTLKPFARVPTGRDELAGAAIVQQIGAISGDVFVPCHGYLAAMAGKPSFAHVWEIADILDASAPALAAPLARELSATLHEQRFSAVLPCSAQMTWLNTAGLSTFYEKAGPLFSPGDRTFLTVAGFRNRPEAIYRPKQ